MATIYEVAQKAGVSAATVSRTLSRPAIVARETRSRVLAAVNELSFVPNGAAKRLRSSHSRRMLVLIPDISNPFFSLVLRGIEDAALAAEYAVLFGDARHDSRREDRYAMMLQQKEVDGLIFLGHLLPPEAESLVASRRPRCAPIVNGCEFPSVTDVPSVQIDNARAAAEVIEYLISLGHRRIGVITGPMSNVLSADRLRGTLLAIHSHDAMAGVLVVHGDYSLESGILAGKSLLERPDPPSAIFSFNDEMAMGVLQAARQCRLSVPGDLSLVGFDDIRFASSFDPPLTTVAQPMQEIGKECVRLLLEILADDSTTPGSVTLPHTLTIRSSVARPRQR